MPAIARPASPAAPATSVAASRPASAPAKPAAAPSTRSAAAASARPAASQRAPEPSSRKSSREPAAGRRASLRPQGAPSRTYEVVEAGEEKPVLDRATKFGFFFALAVALAAGGAYVYVRTRNATEKEIVDKRIALENEFLAELNKLNVNDPVQAAQARPLAEKDRERWEGRESATQVNTILARADAVLKMEEDRKAFSTRLDGMEAQLKQESTMTAVQIADMRRTLTTTMLGQARDFGPESEARVKAMQLVASTAFLNRLLDEGRKFATEHPDEAVAALKKMALAEVEARSQLSTAGNDKKADDVARLDPIYKAIVAEEDALAAKTFTDAFIANVPWRDLIAPADQAKWKKATLKGFAATFDPTKMTLQGPDPDAKGQGSLSIGDNEDWRDFVLEFDFKLKSGSPTFYFRARSKLDNTVENVEFDSLEEGAGGPGIDPAKTYHIAVSFIGSHFKLTPPDEGDINAVDVVVPSSKSRYGAIAIAVPKGCRMEISKMRIKVLR
jgi:hypothetical protein